MEPKDRSLKERFALLPKAHREAWLAKQPPEILEEIIRGAWWWEARPAQVPPPGDWSTFLALAGRGWGKSRAGAEWIVERALGHPLSSAGNPTEHLIVAETLADARAICLEGDSGVLNALRRRGLIMDVDFKYIKSPKPVIQFENGTKIHCEGAKDGNVGRGYNLSSAWLDELIKWPTAVASYDEGIIPALRVDIPGDHPRTFITTTPKAGSTLLKRFLSDSQSPEPHRRNSIVIIRGATFDNASNLNSHTLRNLRNRYEGTQLGEQELYGNIIELAGGALFKMADLERARVARIPEDLRVVSIIVGVDPSLTDAEGDLVEGALSRRRQSGETHDEMGVVVVARTVDDHLWVLDDATVTLAGREAALHVWKTLLRWNATQVVYEENLGKKWMKQVFLDAFMELVRSGEMPANVQPPMTGVDAKLGKKTRAEPVALRSEQLRLHMVGKFPKLEDQLTTFATWDGKESPDRLDAMVHACRRHMLNERNRARIIDPRDLLRGDEGLGPDWDPRRW
jgi:phage terminase large subunit-like protein